MTHTHTAQRLSRRKWLRMAFDIQLRDSVKKMAEYCSPHTHTAQRLSEEGDLVWLLTQDTIRTLDSV